MISRQIQPTNTALITVSDIKGNIVLVSHINFVIETRERERERERERRPKEIPN